MWMRSKAQSGPGSLGALTSSKFPLQSARSIPMGSAQEIHRESQALSVLTQGGTCNCRVLTSTRITQTLNYIFKFDLNDRSQGPSSS
jgi:hypothetical protein